MSDEMQLALAWGLTYDDEEDVIYGKRGGYPILIYTADFENSLLFDISVSVISGVSTLETVKEQLMNSSADIIRDIAYNETKIAIHINDMPDISSVQLEVDKVLDKLAASLAENKFEVCCENCKVIGDTDFL